MKNTVYRSMLAGVLLAVSGAAQSALIDTSLWSAQQGPQTDPRTCAWATGGTAATCGSNTESSLISNFSLAGDFVYSGSLASVTPGDSDNIGFVFGWQNAANHYRVGFEGPVGGPGGDYGDVVVPQGGTGARGFWIAEESGGVGTLLYNNPSVRYSGTNVYDFSVARVGANLTVRLSQGATTLVNQTVSSSTFLSGNVGVYVESQGARFFNLAASEVRTGVPAPGALSLLGLGLLSIGALRRSRRQRQ